MGTHMTGQPQADASGTGTPPPASLGAPPAAPEPSSARRLRCAHVIVQPVFVWDDGEELAPGPQAEAVQVPVSALAGLAVEIAAEVARVTAGAAAGPT